MDVEFTYERERLALDADEWLRRWRVQWWAEQWLVDQIRAREIDPRAFVRIAGI